MDVVLNCPLCSKPGFPGIDSLRIALINSSSRRLVCPICQDVLLGLDKLTIHLVSHSIHEHLVRACFVSNLSTTPLALTSNTENVNNASNNATALGLTFDTPLVINAASSLQAQRSGVEIGQPSCKISESPTCLGFEVPLLEQNRAQEEFQTSNFTICPEECLESLRERSQNNQDNVLESTISSISADHESNAVQQSFAQETFNDQRGKQSDQKDARVSPHRFPCHVCSKVFRMRGSLMVHLRVAHTSFQGVGLTSRRSVEAFSHAFPCTSSDFSTASSPKEQLDIGFLEQTRTHHEQNATSTFFEQNGKESTICPPSVTFFDKHLKSLTSVEAVNHAKSFERQESALHCSSSASELNYDNTEKANYPVQTLAFSPSLSPDMSPASPCLSPPITPDSPPTAHGTFTCTICSKVFPKEAAFNQHVKSHDSKQWECDVCSKLFTTKYFLKKHKRLHTGEMPYKCEICNKSFTFQQSYHKHLLYHSDDKPHTCSDCGRSFKELSTLHNHERIHTGEKPWACETCGKCFRQRVSYLVHRRIHTGAMPYRCTACGKSFRYKVSQRTHKCTAQPPGDVVCQSRDLIQCLLSSSPQEGACSSSGIHNQQAEHEVEHRPKLHSQQVFPDSQHLLKEQLKQLNLKSDYQHLPSHSSQEGEIVEYQIHQQRHHQQQCMVLQPGNNLNLNSGTILKNEQIKRDSENDDKHFTKANLSGPRKDGAVSRNVSHPSCSPHSANELPGSSIELSNLTCSEISQVGSCNDIFQDILSIVMSPTVSPSQQFQHLSLSSAAPKDEGIKTIWESG